MTTQFETLLVEVEGPVALVTVNRPKVLNALNERVLDELYEAIEALGERADVRDLILTGAGDRAFVAGADIAAMAEFSSEQAFTLARKGHRLGDLIAGLGQPVIAAVGGFALGGGLELALACDIVYASEKAKFGLPEVTIGVMPGFAGTQRLPRAVGLYRAAELVYSGEPINAAEAHRIGIVNKVCAPEALLTEARALAHKIAGRAPLAVAKAKQAVRATQELPLSRGNVVEQELFAELFQTQDQKEGMAAFLSKRPPTYTGK